MKHEIINKVEILDSGELLLYLESGGNPSYQYVYREAAGVYWDKDRKGFKSTIPHEMSYPQWFKQIVGVVKTGLAVELKLSESVNWVNVLEQTKNEILANKAI